MMRTSGLTRGVVALTVIGTISLSAFAALSSRGQEPPPGDGDRIDLSKMLPERRFDFLVGSWSVSTASGGHGLETVRSILDGQVIEQEGQMTIDDQGGVMKYKSFFVYDEAADLWRETWVSNFGHHDQLAGKLEGDRMVLYQKKVRDMPNAIGRLSFHHITRISFAMEWEVSADDGKTWEKQISARYWKAPNHPGGG